MVTVTCQHSNIKFEASSTRTKQHPLVADLKAWGNKTGKYAQVQNALDAVAKSGGYSTIGEYMDLVNQHMSGQRAAADRHAAARREEAETARRQREELNALLKANGYTWHVEIVDRDACALETRDEGKYFYLTSPDGREVSVSQALDEIERGADVVAAEAAAAVQAEIDEQTATQAEADRIADAYKTVEVEAKALVQVEPFNSADFSQVAHWRISNMSLREIRKGTINGVICYVISVYGDMDYSTYYCADPVAAGLTATDKVDDANLFSWFFD